MIRNDFTSASIAFWRKHEAEKQAIQKRNLIQGIFMIVSLPVVFIVLSFVFANKAHATGLVDLKFGQAQIADSQWNVQSCTQTATCQIYSKNPGTAYKIPWYSGQIQWAAGDYIRFQAWTPDPNNPWVAIQYAANGTQKEVMGTGHIINMGTDYFFFVGNDNNTGQLFSMTQGFANTSGVTWTGTLNPTTAQVNTYAQGGSTTPLAAGQTAAPPQSSTPTVTGTSTTNSVSSSSTTENGFSQNLVTDVTYNGGTISGNDSVIYGSSTTTNTTTTTTPVTTTTYSDGTSTSTNGTSSTSQSTTTTYDVWKAYQIPSWSYTIPVVSGNSVYLNQSGINPTVIIEQVGQRNAVAGINNQNAYLVGNNNTLTTRQAGDDNLILVKVQGNSNAIQIPQGYYHNWANGAESPATGSSNERAMVSILGDNNWVFLPQQGLNNLATSTTVGSNNQNTIVQYGNDNKSYNYINGNGNILNNWQQGNSNLSSINLYGNSNQASVTQTGNNNSSTINLTNAGGANNITVTQSNSTNAAGNNFMLNQTCYLAAGCNVTVTQSK